MAKLRLEFPEATLQELVDASCGKLGKSGMNHRLRKLEELAAEFEVGDNSET
jgi:DNA-binding transcriptional regulator WhiA